jgi:hypothetical protein
MTKKILLHVCVFTIITSLQSLAHAWIDPVDFNADQGIGEPFHKFTLKNGTTIYDRCDTPITEYGFKAAPSICHRWGLVFEYGNKPTIWEPKFSGDILRRLPTIKELVRLFNYTDGTGLDEIIESWLTTVDANTWLISSSYRDIDGNYDAGGAGTGRLQIFALNAFTGEVKTFYPNFEIDIYPLRLCESLESNGDCVLDFTATNIYALKVNQTLLKDL